MPLVTERDKVLEVYEKAANRGWVVPTFCSENLTTTEAVLAAAGDYGARIRCPDLPVSIAITNLYGHRSQTLNYTFSGSWRIGLKLFLADIEALCSPGSPYEALSVMTHLDHIQPEADAELLGWDMTRFSSIMFDASAVPFELNIELTARFAREHGTKIVIEGACDEIVDATGNRRPELTTPDQAERFVTRTGVDFIVANLGTEHRASAAELRYHGDVAREIKSRVGPKIVLHGCSSVSNEQVTNLFSDGVAKVNIWTALERDSSPALLREMVKNAARVAGPQTARRLADEKLLGPRADLDSRADLGYFTTSYRQRIVFNEMKRIALGYLELWYR